MDFEAREKRWRIWMTAAQDGDAGELREPAVGAAGPFARIRRSARLRSRCPRGCRSERAVLRASGSPELPRRTTLRALAACHRPQRHHRRVPGPRSPRPAGGVSRGRCRPRAAASRSPGRSSRTTSRPSSPGRWSPSRRGNARPSSCCTYRALGGRGRGAHRNLPIRAEGARTTVATAPCGCGSRASREVERAARPRSDPEPGTRRADAAPACDLDPDGDRLDRRLRRLWLWQGQSGFLAGRLEGSGPSPGSSRRLAAAALGGPLRNGQRGSRARALGPARDVSVSARHRGSPGCGHRRGLDRAGAAADRRCDRGTLRRDGGSAGALAGRRRARLPGPRLRARLGPHELVGRLRRRRVGRAGSASGLRELRRDAPVRVPRRGPPGGGPRALAARRALATGSAGTPRRVLRSRRLFRTTQTLEAAIAAAAHIGERPPVAANGRAAAL